MTETPEEKAERERRKKESPKKIQDWMKQIEKTVPKVGDGKPIKKEPEKKEDKKKKK